MLGGAFISTAPAVFNLIDISGSRFFWDISSFTTNGTITIVQVPEPSRLLLLGLAAALLFVGRQR